MSFRKLQYELQLVHSRFQNLAESLIKTCKQINLAYYIAMHDLLSIF